MCRLFRRSDQNMSEDKKLRHLMRGVKQEIFAGLLRCPPRNVAEFRTEATAVEKTLQQRARHYNRDVNVASVDAVSAVFGNGIDVLRELIRSVVREELQKLNGNPSTVSSLAEVVREEVRQAVREQQPQAQPVQASVPMQPAVSYAEVLRSAPVPHFVAPGPPFAAPGPYFAAASTHLPKPRFTPSPAETRIRKADIWRTPDRIPLCYHCGEAGHLYRMCEYRRAGLRGFPVNAACPRNGERRFEIEGYLSMCQGARFSQQHQSWSTAPLRYRSPSPRPSSNSPRRLPQSPLREN